MFLLQDFRGWDVCQRPHSAENSGYLRFTAWENRENHLKNRSHSASAKLSAKREKLPLSKVQINWPARNQSNSQRSCQDSPENSARDRMEDAGNMHVGSGHNFINIPVAYNPSLNNNPLDQIPYEFEHFVHPKDHIRKYR